MFPRQRFDRPQIESDALDTWMSLRNFNAKQSCRATDITQRAVAREIEFLGQRFKVDPRKAGHCVKELLQLRRIRIELLENTFFALLGFVLRLTGSQGLRQAVPEFEEPCVQHLQNSTYVSRALPIQIQSRRGRIEIFGVLSFAFALQKFHYEKRIEEICDAARMQAEFFSNLRAGEPVLPQFAE